MHLYTWHASISYDKYGWIKETYDVLRIVSGKKRFSLYKSPLGFATLGDISIIYILIGWKRMFLLHENNNNNNNNNFVETRLQDTIGK